MNFRYLFTVILIVLAFPAVAQFEGSAFTGTGRGAVNAFAKDYQATGINPANVAIGNKWDRQFVLGLGEIGFSSYAAGFDKEQQSDAWLAIDDEISYEEKVDAALGFAGEPLTLNTTITYLGFAAHTANAGSFSFTIQENIAHYSEFNTEAARNLFLGFNSPYFDMLELENGETRTQETITEAERELIELGYSSSPIRGGQLYSPSEIRSLWYRSYGLTYGKGILSNDKVQLYGGVTVEYLEGYMFIDALIENDEVDDAFASSTPGLGIDYGESTLEGDEFTPVGSGFGVDLGLTLELNDKFRFSASVVDIGSITFDKNIHQAKDTLLADTREDGIDSYNFFTEFDDFLGEDGALEWSPVGERTVNLPTTLRTGVFYKINDQFNAGLDVNIPFSNTPGAIETIAVGGGIDYMPVDGIRLSTGFTTGGGYGFNVPFGINFITKGGGYEAGIAFRDVKYFFTQDDPVISFAFGFLRFRFGNMQTEYPSRMYNSGGGSTLPE